MEEILVHIGISKSTIHCSDELKRYISDWMTVLDPKRYYSKLFRERIWDGKHRFYNLKDSSIRTGLVPFLASKIEMKSTFLDMDLKVIIQDGRKNIPLKGSIELSKNMLKGITLRDTQMKALEAIYKGGMNILGRGIIESWTGSGKSEILCCIVKLIDAQVLLIAPDVYLGEQLFDRLEKRGVSASLYRGQEDFDFSSRVVVSNIQMLYSRFKKKSKNLLDYLRGVGAVLLDEVQFSAADSYKALFDSMENCSVRYGVSGTPFRSDEISDLTLLGEIGNRIVKIGARELIEEGAVSIPRFFIDRLVDKPKTKNLEGMNYAEVYKYLIVENLERNTKIVEYAKKLSDSGLKSLIFVTNLDHGKKLLDLLKEADVNTPIFLDGSNDMSIRSEWKNKFEIGECSTLVATRIFDAGVDLDGGTNAVILAGGGKSRQRLLQRSGRGARLQKDKFNQVLIIDFQDKGKYVKDHAIKRENLLKYFKFQIEDSPDTVDKFIGEILEWRKTND